MGHDADKVNVPVPVTGVKTTVALAVVPVVMVTVVEPEAMTLLDASNPFTLIVHEPVTRLLKVNDPVGEFVTARVAPEGPVPEA